MSIFGKFSLMVGLALLVAVGAVSFLSMVSQREALTRQAVLRGESIALNLAAASSEALITRDPVSLVTLGVAAIQNHHDVAYAAVLASNKVRQGHPDWTIRGREVQLKVPGQVRGCR